MYSAVIACSKKSTGRSHQLHLYTLYSGFIYCIFHFRIVKWEASNRFEWPHYLSFEVQEGEGQLLLEEVSSQNSISWRTIHVYCQALGGTHTHTCTHISVFLEGAKHTCLKRPNHFNVFCFSVPSGYFLAVVILLLFVTLSVGATFSNLFLAYWMDQGSGVRNTHPLTHRGGNGMLQTPPVEWLYW